MRPAGPGVRDARNGAVAVHRPSQRAVAANVEIFLSSPGTGRSGNQKPIPVAVNADASGKEIAALRCGHVMEVGELNQFAAAGEAIDGGFDRGAVVAFGAQFPEKMFEAGFSMRLLQNVVEQRGILHPFILIKGFRNGVHPLEQIRWHNIDAMRYILVLLPALMLTAQAQTPTASVKKVSDTKVASTAPLASYKESGSPTAPVTMELYTDFECPACRSFFLEVMPEVTRDFIATGKLRLIHRDFRLPQHQFTKLATKYANAAGQIGKYDIVIHQIFLTQPDWSQNGNVEATVAKVLAPADMEKLRAIVKSDTHLDRFHGSR